MKPWIKLYTEINRDPKMITLTWQQRGIWAALLATAGEIDDRDEADCETGELDTLEYTALRIRCDLEELESAVQVFIDRGMVEYRGDTLFVTHYSERQKKSPSQTRQANKERQQAHRTEQTGHKDVTTLSQDVTALDTDTDTDSDTDSDSETETETDSEADEKRKEKAGAVAPPGALVPGAPVACVPVPGVPVPNESAALVFRRWMDINPRKLVTQVDVDSINDLINDYGAPEVASAIVTANANGKPYLAYVEGILKKRREGIPKPQARPEPQAKHEPPFIWKRW